MYPELIGLPYDDQLSKFTSLEKARLEIEQEKWKQWRAGGSIGEEPELVFSTPLLRIVWREQTKLNHQERLSRRYYVGKKGAIIEKIDFLRWLNDGLRQQSHYMEDWINRAKQ